MIPPRPGLGAVLSLGFTQAAGAAVGVLAGYWLDRRLQTQPVFTILLLLFGVAAGFFNLVFGAAQARRAVPPRTDPLNKPGA